MLKKILAVIAIVFLTAVFTYMITMSTLSVTTDGDGDSAFIKAFGIEWFIGINGYEVRK